ncbi:transposase [Bacillus thuringiensis]|uniref:transposase n=1 Tax=Bacillus thuringiensis TaxID=1428 RepID=UPI003D07585D
MVKEGRTLSSIQREFDLGHGTLHSWIKKYSSPLLDNEGTDMQELRSLRREIQALQKENEFLKHTKISSTDQGIGFVLLFFYSRSEETVASPLGS